jgi:hypothetical protein
LHFLEWVLSIGQLGLESTFNFLSSFLKLLNLWGLFLELRFELSRLLALIFELLKELLGLGLVLTHDRFDFCGKLCLFCSPVRCGVTLPICLLLERFLKIFDFLFEKGFFFFELRCWLSDASLDLLSLILVFFLADFELILWFSQLLLQLGDGILAVSIVLLLAEFEFVELLFEDLVGGFELRFGLEGRLPLAFKSQLLCSGLIFGFSQLARVSFFNLSFKVGLKSLLVRCMTTLDREEFERECKFGFSEVVLFLRELEAVCIVIVGELS